ncbi:unnamed protein product [Rhizophagus irregularis]|nr:unnamed protein product [Rhizophagus irregularis]CAB5180929.1 unnamed protein product [Rhizophagus irregularis]
MGMSFPARSGEQAFKLFDRVNTLQVQEVDIDINGILIFILMTGIYIKILRIRAHRLLKLFDKCYTVYFLQD